MFIIPAPQASAFKLFGLSVYYYGITMALAIFVSVVLANYLLNKSAQSVKNFIFDISAGLIIFGLLGARLYFCLLNLGHYLHYPVEILNFRAGGLSIHGGIISGIVYLFFVAKKYNALFLQVLDCVGCATAIGQAIGRWGNYFNSEAYGLPIKAQNWGLFIPYENRLYGYETYSLFHPTFLYESIMDFVAFLCLFYIILRFGKKYYGVTFFSYLIFYAVIRMITELLRLDSALYIANFSIAFLVSLAMLIIGTVGVICCLKRNID